MIQSNVIQVNSYTKITAHNVPEASVHSLDIRAEGHDDHSGLGWAMHNTIVFHSEADVQRTIAALQELLS